MPEAKPILIIGLNRSGTKWLCNLVAQHPDVYAVQDPTHFGILETNVLNDLPRLFPSLEREEDRAAFTALWQETDFIRITKVNLPELIDQFSPKTVFEAFQVVMSNSAASHGCCHWLQKCSPIQYWMVRRHFPNVARIVIQRRFQDVWISTTENDRVAGSSSFVIPQAAVYALQDRALRGIARDTTTLKVDYESLTTDPETVVASVFSHLNLPSFGPLDFSPFRKNTSFEGSKVRPRVGLMPRVLAFLFKFALYALPTSFATWSWKRLRRNRRPVFIRGTYSKWSQELAREFPTADGGDSIQAYRNE